MRKLLYTTLFIAVCGCKPSPEDELLKKLSADIKTKTESSESVALDKDCNPVITVNGSVDNSHREIKDSIVGEEHYYVPIVVGGYKATITGHYTQGALARHLVTATYYCSRLDGKPNYDWHLWQLDIK